VSTCGSVGGGRLTHERPPALSHRSRIGVLPPGVSHGGRDVNPFDLVHAVWILLRAVVEIREFHATTEESLRNTDPEWAEFVSGCNARVKHGLLLFLLVGCLLLPMFIAWGGRLAYGYSASAAWEMMFCGMILSTFPLGAVHGGAGMCAAFLCLPPEFAETQTGKLWMELIGAKTLRGARTACCFALLFSATIMSMVGWLLIHWGQMSQFR